MFSFMVRQRMPKAETIDRQKKVIELRRQGLTFREIAPLAGYADSGAAVNAYRRGMANSLREAGSDQLRELELERLDALQAAIWSQAISGDLPAVGQVLKIMERRAKLFGLDMPVRHEVVVETVDASAIDAEMQRLVAFLGAQKAPVAELDAPSVEIGDGVSEEEAERILREGI